jgi:putative transcriptional regulator
MKTREIEFNAEELVRAVEVVADHAAGRDRQKLRVTKITSAKPAPALSPAQIRALRSRLKVSQADFAAVLNVPVVTAASWERGQRSPSGAALRLLQIVRKNPELVAKLSA